MQREHLASFVLARCEKHGNLPALRVKRDGRWQETTYREFGRQARAIAQALAKRGLDRGERAGIFAPNSPEWAIADLGILAAHGVAVPIYATNTASQTRYIINDAGMKLLFVGEQEHYDKVKSVQQECPTLKTVVVFDEAVALRDGDLTLADFLREGETATDQESRIEENLATGETDDLATLIYTSGTTGEPKGVMLTHANFFHQFHAIDEHFKVSTADRSLCFMPLSHVFERSWSYYIFVNGASNSYLANPREAVEAFKEVRPTAMISVPRLYEKVYSTVLAKLEKASPLKRSLFHWAVRVGKQAGYARVRGGPDPFLRLQHFVADRLVLGKIREAFGGPKNFLAAGGAALASEIEEFFFAAGIMVCQGFGLTETSPTVTANRPDDFRFGTVGKPVKDVEVKIAPDGEVLVKGPNVMKGYFNKPEATLEAFDEEGYFRTGDIGLIDDDGYLHITDRKKDLIITSGGKNVAPQHIEVSVGQDFYIEQLVAIGDGRKFISALVVPNFEALEGWAREQGLANDNRDELVRLPAIQAFYRKRIDDQSTDLAPYEQIKKFVLLPHEFSQETGEMTPTLKVKRKAVNEKYADLIDAMYE